MKSETRAALACEAPVSECLRPARTRWSINSFFISAASLLLGAQAHAVEPYQEYEKRVESSRNLTALKSELFGDKVSLFNGKTEFVVTDIDVPGNNGLPVQLTRRFSVEIQPSGLTTYDAKLGGAGGWDIEVPYVTGMFGPISGWGADRCSRSIVPTVATGFNVTEIWQGNSIHIPGAGDRTMLRLESATPKPADGSAPLWTTSERDMIDCIPLRAGSAIAGEGYRLRTSAGLKYHFDLAVLRTAGTMTRTNIVGDAPVRVGRTRAFLLASKIEDPFGNTVQYQYNATGHPTRIWSSDGREITLTYQSGRLSSAASHGATWQYQYAPVEHVSWLSTVIRPDQSRWGYGYSNALAPPYEPWDGGSSANCMVQPPHIPHSFNLTVTHPSGAVGTFNFNNRRHGRSGVHASECLQRVSSGQYHYVLNTPNFFDVMSISTKSVTGPGIPDALDWSYSYGPISQSLWGSRTSPATYPCTTCLTEKAVTVVNPDSTWTRYRYGFQYALNEGRLLGQSIYDASGVERRSESTEYLSEADAPSQVFHDRFGLIWSGDDPSTARVRPAVKRTIEQESTSFVWQVSKTCGGGSNFCFDEFGRPTKEQRSSAPTP